MLVYTFVLYSPIAFFTNIGGHVYRNAIITPMVFIVVALLLFVSHQILFRRKNIKTGFAYSVLLGISFLFFYYIKEDSIWLLPFFVIMLVVSIISLFIGRADPVKGKIRFKYLLIAIIPILILFGGINAYKAMNLHYFGVFENNTRTEGAFADFSSRLFKISDENKTEFIWLPFSTFEKAWEVSPTLREYPEVLEFLRTSAWSHGDMEVSPPGGDLALWAFREALLGGKLYESEKQTADVLKTATAELDEAFQNGTLQKEEGKIYLSKAARGRTIQEIMQIVPRFETGFSYHAFYKGYTVERIPRETEQSNPDLSGRHDIVEGLINDKLPRPETYYQIETRLAIGASKLIIGIYQVLAYITIPLSIIGFAIVIASAVKRKDGTSRFVVLTMAMLVLTTLALMLGVAWFSEWLSDLAIAMYSVGAVATIQFFEIFGILYFVDWIRRLVCKSESELSLLL